MAADKRMGEMEYRQMVEVMASVDHHLEQGTRHYRDVEGRLLMELEQVVEALLADRLAADQETEVR